jgi:hypothetical protein
MHMHMHTFTRILGCPRILLFELACIRYNERVIHMVPRLQSRARVRHQHAYACQPTCCDPCTRMAKQNHICHPCAQLSSTDISFPSEIIHSSDKLKRVELVSRSPEARCPAISGRRPFILRFGRRSLSRDQNEKY